MHAEVFAGIEVGSDVISVVLAEEAPPPRSVYFLVTVSKIKKHTHMVRVCDSLSASRFLYVTLPKSVDTYCHALGVPSFLYLDGVQQSVWAVDSSRGVNSVQFLTSNAALEAWARVCWTLVPSCWIMHVSVWYLQHCVHEEVQTTVYAKVYTAKCISQTRTHELCIRLECPYLCTLVITDCHKT